MTRSEMVAQLMVELTGRYEVLAANTSELQRTERYNFGRIAMLGDETHAAPGLIEAVSVMRGGIQLGLEWQDD